MLQTPGINTIQKEDRQIHDWYRFVLSYPPHLVRRYFERFGVNGSSLVFDPFCGTGTTLVEAKHSRIPSAGCDAHPFALLVSKIKTTWDLDGNVLKRRLRRILDAAGKEMTGHDLEEISFESSLVRECPAGNLNGYKLTEDEEKLMPTGFMSDRPLRRLLILRDEIEEQCSREKPARDFFLIALAHVIANGAGNFAFGPEIYRTRAKPDYDVTGHFAMRAGLMIEEMRAVQQDGLAGMPCCVFADDARLLKHAPGGVSAVITSPPYPNEKDYTRTTRVESLLLKLFSDRADLRAVKESLLRSNTRNVFVNDRDGDEVAEFESIQKVCRQIEERREELGKTSGFERLYHKVVAHYFGGMRRHFRALFPKLKRGAQLAYVVGDQLSFLMVPVRTATLLGEVAEAEGYRLAGCDLWRERTGTKVRNSRDKQKTVRIAEEVLILEKP